MTRLLLLQDNQNTNFTNKSVKYTHWNEAFSPRWPDCCVNWVNYIIYSIWEMYTVFGQMCKNRLNWDIRAISRWERNTAKSCWLPTRWNNASGFLVSHMAFVGLKDFWPKLPVIWTRELGLFHGNESHRRKQMVAGPLPCGAQIPYSDYWGDREAEQSSCHCSATCFPEV